MRTMHASSFRLAHPKSRIGLLANYIAAGLIVGVAGVYLAALSSAQAASYSPPATIAADCSVNVSSALNSWLASVPNGSTIQFRGGCYRIDQELNIVGRNNLLIDGGGATFKAVDPTGDSSSWDAQGYCSTGYSAAVPDKAARTRDQWRVNTSSNITFADMIVEGANPCGGTGSYAYVSSLEAQHAFDVDGGNSNITLHDVQAYDTYGDFIYFRGTSNGHVYNSHFERDGRQGISVTGGGPVLVENSYFNNTRRATFDLEPNTTSSVVDGVTIRNNTVGAGRLLFVAAHGSGPVNDVTIENNTLSRCMSISDAGSASLRRHNWTVQNNTTTGGCGSPAPDAPFAFTYTDHVRILNNKQPIQANRGDNGVDIHYVTDIQVNSNSFVNAVAALYGYNNWEGDSAYSACNNQLTANGPFNQPQVCTSGSTGSGGGSGGSSGGSGSTGGSGGGSANNTAPSASSSPTSGGGGVSGTTASGSPATAASGGVSGWSAPAALSDTTLDPTASVFARAKAALLLYGGILLALIVVAYVVRLLGRLAQELQRHHVTRHFATGDALNGTLIAPSPPPALDHHDRHDDGSGLSH